MKRFRVNQHSTRLGMEQPALLRHFGSTALRVALARLRNSPCPPAWPRHGSNSPRRPPPPSWHGGPPRLAKSRCPRLRDSRSSLLHPTGNPSGQGNRDFAGEARWCVARRSTRGPAVQGCANLHASSGLGWNGCAQRCGRGVICRSDSNCRQQRRFR
jgi:hypothetical protein